LDLKITTMISWFGPQNQAGFGLSVELQNRHEDEDGARYASKSSGFLCDKASRVSVSHSGLKTGGGVAWMVHVASSRMLRRDQAEDGRVDVTGYIGLFYPNFIIFYVLGS
jgi:hypothetical protein